ncbi:MAG: hypothetical protein NTW14_09670 [bacterium]|nr:hypothetical protein [bacterium]
MPTYSPDNPIFMIYVGDVQNLAKEKLGRELDEFELHTVQKGIEGGFCDWHEVVGYAINELEGLREEGLL